MKNKLILSLLIVSISAIFLISCTKREDTSNDMMISDKLPWSDRIAQSFVKRHPGSVTYDEFNTKKGWTYEQGVMLEGMMKMYELTGDKVYNDFIIENLDQYINDEGKIRTYPYHLFNLDKVKPGRALLYAYKLTKNEKYKIAADTLMKQIKNQPRTLSGGFWHKKRYPFQMWLDGLFMAEPFYADYTAQFGNKKDYQDIIKQFTLSYEKTVDPKTGLLYHAWNENKEQKWADPETGKAPNVWGRAMGWYTMAIVEVLDIIPENEPGRDKLIKILKNVTEAVLKYRDKESGLWYQIIDKQDKEGNYLEASCAAMFNYTFIKGANKGYLGKEYVEIATNTFKALIKYHVEIEKNGYINYLNTCAGAGLGGNPYRDGSFEYYMSVPTKKNDFKGYGPFLYTAIELDKAKAL